MFEHHDIDDHGPEESGNASEHHDSESTTEAFNGSDAGSTPSVTPSDADGRTRTSEVLDLIAGVENQLEQMRSAQTACADEIDSIETRRQEIADREQELVDLGRQFDERRDSLDDRAREMDDRESRLGDRKTELDAIAGDLESREQGHEQRRAEFERMQESFDADRARFESERAALLHDREQFEQEREVLSAERVAAEAEVTALKARTEEIETTFHALNQERDALTTRVAELTESRQELESRANTAEGRASTLETEMIDLSSKLEDAASAIERRDEEIAGHRASIDKARSETEELENRHADLTTRLSDRDAELEDLQASLKLATERLQSLADAVSEQAPRLEEGATAIALCRQQEQRMKTLNEELASAREEIRNLGNSNDPDGVLDSTREELSRLRAEIEEMIPLDEHSRVVNSLESRLADASEGSSDVEAGDEALRRELEQARREFEDLSAHAEGCEESLRDAANRISELQNENTRLEQTSCIPGNDASDDADRLRQQAHRLADFAVHLQRRRSRLQAVRSVIGRKTRGSSDAPEATPTSIEGDRRNKAAEEDLLRRRHELVDLESRMIRRWASEGSVGTVLRIVVLVMVVAAASWFSVRWFAPGSVSASALVKAQPVAGSGMDDERGMAWNSWHEAILDDKLFAKAVAARLAAAPGGYEGGTDAVASFIADDLDVTAIQPGMLSFQLKGSDQSAVLNELEAVVSTLASESQRQMARRGDGARVDVQTRDGRIASLDPVPVTSSQIQYAGMAFGGSLGLIVLLGAVVYNRLSRSRRLFDENLGIEEAEMI